MSLSSPSSEGSIDTRFTSCRQVITTFTRPAPDWPSTSVLRELLLRLLHVVLHLLGLLHQAGELVLHHGRCSSSRIGCLPASTGQPTGLMESGCTLPSKRSTSVADERFVAEGGFGSRARLVALAALSVAASEAGVGVADLEREHQLAAGRLLERDLELVRIGLVGEMLVRRGQRER